MNYKCCWITVNRACNFRCKWCYAQGTNYKISDDMDLATAYKIVDICYDLKISNIILIGGEPTIYPHFFDVIDYCHKKNIRCGIISNGLVFKDINYVEKLVGHNVKSLAISLKGEDRQSFNEIAQVNGFDDVIEGIKNCVSVGIEVTVSMVIIDENVDTFINGIKLCKDIGVNRFNFSFCNNFDDSGVDNHYLETNNPKLLIRKFVKHIDELKTITNNNFSFHNIYPICLWENNSYDEMSSNDKIYTICQLLNKSGLIFDNEGYLIPCNAMYSVKLGKLYDDFDDAKSLIKYTKSSFIKNAYKQLCGVPNLSCLECDKLSKCGGGCVCQWTNYNFEQLMNR